MPIIIIKIIDGILIGNFRSKKTLKRTIDDQITIPTKESDMGCL